MMRATDRLRFAALALSRYPWRAVTLILAVAASVSSVLMMTALGEGARNYVIQEFSSLGKEMLVLLPGRKQTTGGIPPMGSSLRDMTLGDVAYLERRLPNVRIAPLIVGSGEAKFGSRLRNTLIMGSTPAFQLTHQLRILEGQGLPAIDSEQNLPVCLVGETLARELFGEQPAVGKWVRLDNRRFRIIGLFQSSTSSMGLRMDENVLIPVGAAQVLFNTQALFRIFIQALAGQHLDSLSDQVLRFMTERHQGIEDVTVLRPDSLLATFGNILLTLTLAVAGIGAISLVVAGIMMMNLSLISVQQRSHEIGLLKALGASAALIRQLFLTEALLLALIGGMLGLGIGYLAVLLMLKLYPAFPLAIPPMAAGAALACALITGLFFSWLPAHRAARKPVVDSLRGGG